MKHVFLSVALFLWTISAQAASNQLTPIDIIWVVDNSGSMEPWQKLMISVTQEFFSSLKSSGFDAKIGLLSTDYRDAPYVGFADGDELYSGSLDSSSRFIQALDRLGTMGDGTEIPFLKIQDALKRFPKFHRVGAALVILVVTDEGEQSGIKAKDFFTSLVSLAGQDLKFFYPVLGASDLGCGATWMKYKKSSYEELVDLLGHGKGNPIPLCQTSSDMADSFRDIIKDLHESIKRDE